MRYTIIVTATLIMLGTIIITTITIIIAISPALVNAYVLIPSHKPPLGNAQQIQPQIHQRPIHQQQLQRQIHQRQQTHGVNPGRGSNSSEVCAPHNTNQSTSIAISTDRRNYIVGDALQIYIYALDKNGCAVTTKVNLTLDNTSSGPKSSHIFEESLYSDSDPNYNIFIQL